MGCLEKYGIVIKMPKQQKYLLGLDAGNTVIKAVLFDLDGAQIAVSALDGQSATPEPGHVERDLHELWDNARSVIRDCITKAGISASKIAGIGCAGHGNGLYLLDKDNEPMLGVQSLDSRAAGVGEALSRKSGDRLHALCLQRPWPSQTSTILAWLKKYRREEYAKAGTILLCKDFITFKLTGALVSDISDMSGAGLLRMPDCVYDDDLMAEYGLEDAINMLPRLIEPSECAGSVTAEAAELTGLQIGTPVVGGLFDVIASALGSGVVYPGQASIIAGTWSINQVFSRKPVIDQTVFIVSGFEKDRFVNIEASATSAANLEWYVREFVEHGPHHDDPFGYCNARINDITPSADDPIFHPFLYGSGQGAEMRAGFYGLAGWHTQGHVLRALFEGVVFEHRRHIEQLVSAGVHFDDAVLSGGGARSPVWPQIFADCLGKNLTVAACQETGALGAAIAAGCGADIFDSFEAGVSRMTKALKIFHPDAEMKQHYDRRYEQYLNLTAAMQEFWNAQQASCDKGQ